MTRNAPLSVESDGEGVGQGYRLSADGLPSKSSGVVDVPDLLRRTILQRIFKFQYFKVKRFELVAKFEIRLDIRRTADYF